MKWIFSLGLSLLALSAWAQEPAAQNENARLNVVLAAPTKSPWDRAQMSALIERTNKILSQCQIEIHVVKIQEGLPEDMSVDRRWISYANAATRGMKVPMIFLVNHSERKTGAGLTPNSKFILLSAESLTPAYKKARPKGYESLAHELGHLLGLEGHTSKEDGKNLMAASKTLLNTELTRDQCRKMKASSYLL
jgi:hypothetical protein